MFSDESLCSRHPLTCQTKSSINAETDGRGGAEIAAQRVNSSALINRSLLRILRLSRNRPLALIGPSTPLTARLHEYGVAVLGGFVARDANGLAMAIKAGAMPKDFGKFGRHIHLKQE
jgi:hypothetical protein